MASDSAGYREHCGECRHFMINAWLIQVRFSAYGVDASAPYYCDALRKYVNASDSPQNPLCAAAGCTKYEKANGVDNEPNPKENRC